MTKPGQTSPLRLRLGTRGSRLAIAQSQMIADALMAAHDGLHMELITIRTSGDRIADRPLAALGGKGLFTKEIEQALLESSIDLAVHSYKDVPITMPLVDVSALMIAAVPTREDPRDVLIMRGKAEPITEPVDAIHAIDALPNNARVGTGSLRRRCQLLDRRPDLRVESIRGNIDTRLRKLRDGEHDAIVLALAGLRRGGLFDAATMLPLPIEQMLPSPGQGALALQCRHDDEQTIRLLRPLHDETTARCVEIEREVVAALNGDCHSPIAALATIERDRIRLRAAAGRYDGALPVRRAESSGALEEASAIARCVADLII